MHCVVFHFRRVFRICLHSPLVIPASRSTNSFVTFLEQIRLEHQNFFFIFLFFFLQAETLNSEIGSAFSSAYTLQRSRDDMSCASGRDSRASIRSVQTNSGRPDSSMSMRSVQSRAESRAEYPRAEHTRMHSDSRPVSRTAGAEHRYIYDYDHDYG